MSLKKVAIIAFVVAAIFAGIGFFKMYAYQNPNYVEEETAMYEAATTVNAYVGGDAYNYIINAGKATANFVVSLIFVVIGFGCYIIHLLKVRNELLRDLVPVRDKEVVEQEVAESLEPGVSLSSNDK